MFILGFASRPGELGTEGTTVPSRAGRCIHHASHLLSRVHTCCRGEAGTVPFSPSCPQNVFSTPSLFRIRIRLGCPTNGSPSGFPRGSSYPRETGNSALPNLISLYPSICAEASAPPFSLLLSGHRERRRVLSLLATP